MTTIRIKYIHLFGAAALFLLIFAAALFLSKSEELANETAERVKAICQSHALGKETCYAREFREIARRQGFSYAFETLALLQEIDPQAKGCHLIAHGIGLGAYEKEPQNWQTLAKAVSSGCNYGAIHGVIEGYLGSSGQALTKEILPEICGERPRADCNHIVGHLALVETKANLDEALELCEALKDPWQNQLCLTGVFMEYQTALNLIAHGYAPESWLDWPKRLEELEAVCRSYSGAEGEACWEEIAHAALVKFKYNPSAIFSFCAQAQVAPGQKRCSRHALGIMAAQKNFELDKLKNICTIKQVGDPSFEGDCYAGLVASLLSTLPQEREKAIMFCNSLSKEFRLKCSTQANSPDFRLD